MIGPAAPSVTGAFFKTPKRNATVKAMKWISLRIGTLLVALAIGVLSGAPQATRAEVVPTPELGVTWEFECDIHGKQQVRLTASVKAIEDGALVIAFEKDGKTGIKHYPVSTWPLGFHTEEKSPNRTRHREVDSGSLSFAQLAVGEKVKAWVRQFDSKWGRNRWKWSAEIKDQITVETESFGPLQVFVIEQKASSPEWGYGTTVVSHYSPKMNIITYWKERDTNGRVEECRLVSRK